MFTGDVRSGLTYEMRPGVERDRYARPDERVWRYFPKQHFIDAVQTGSLFFTRLSTYVTAGDAFEGSTPRPFAEQRDAHYAGRGVDIEAYRRESAEFWLKMLQTVLVNCWHKRDHESLPMWERYVGDRPGIAVTTTLERLITAMPEAVTVGHVEYVDFDTDGSFTANPYARAFMKRKELEDEREVRADLMEPPITENGRWSIEVRAGEELGHRVPVDLGTLIESVVLSPSSASARGEIADVLRSASLDVPLEDSKIGRPPMY